MTININQRATVRLTPYGMEVLRALDEANTRLCGGLAFERAVRAAANGGVFTTQIWGLMHDFGGALMTAGGDVPFDRCEIEIHEDAALRVVEVRRSRRLLTLEDA